MEPVRGSYGYIFDLIHTVSMRNTSPNIDTDEDACTSDYDDTHIW